ncbi:hypothetical protein LCGC14_1904790 [marine sediment metagenome]|uniref:Uncharacterized protein n=1 Tax=marine sediment metagenome TaxID=412755 RepID=A0A0F9FVV6_9ZZZZ
MSGFTEETDCPKCGGEFFHKSTDNRDIEGNYAYCLDCGHSYAMTEAAWSLEEVNEERIEWELKPLTELKKQVN